MEPPPTPVPDAWEQAIERPIDPFLRQLRRFSKAAALFMLLFVLPCSAMLYPIIDDVLHSADRLVSTKNLGDLGKAANTYKIDMKQWPMANGASFWVVLYQNQYVSKLTMFLSPMSGDSNSGANWPIGKTARTPIIAPGDVSFAGPKSWAALPLTGNNGMLMGSEDDEGPPHYDDGMATVEPDGRAKFLIWPEINPAAPEGPDGAAMCRVGIDGRLADLAN
jgi:hypothetical protein